MKRPRPYPMEYVPSICEPGMTWSCITPRWCSWVLYIWKRVSGKEVRIDWVRR